MLAGQIGYMQEVPDPFERELYRPWLNGTRWITQRAQVIQSDSVNQYVGYIFLIVVLVLLLRLLPQTAMFKKILVGFDGSKTAWDALREKAKIWLSASRLELQAARRLGRVEESVLGLRRPVLVKLVAQT
jgi:hypothetical protein